jgi:hypothetical protein
MLDGEPAVTAGRTADLSSAVAEVPIHGWGPERAGAVSFILLKRPLCHADASALNHLAPRHQLR